MHSTPQEQNSNIETLKSLKVILLCNTKFYQSAIWVEIYGWSLTIYDKIRTLFLSTYSLFHHHHQICFIWLNREILFQAVIIFHWVLEEVCFVSTNPWPLKLQVWYGRGQEWEEEESKQYPGLWMDQISSSSSSL